MISPQLMPHPLLDSDQLCSWEETGDIRIFSIYGLLIRVWGGDGESNMLEAWDDAGESLQIPYQDHLGFLTPEERQ